MIFKPWMKIVAAAILIGLLTAGFLKWKHGIYRDGYSARDAIAQADEARIKDEAQNKFILAQHEAALRERNLREELSTQEKNRIEKEKKHEATIARYLSDARNGALQLRIATTTDKVSGDTRNQGSGTPTGSGGSQDSIVMPEVAATILGIAGEMGRDMRQINGLIDAYEALKKECR